MTGARDAGAATAFTPGPWRLFVETAFAETGDTFRISRELSCINGLSAWFTLAKVYEPDESERGYTDGALDRDVAEANARLIAAAPDLYEVACRVAEHFADTDAPLGEAARAALAKVSP